MKLILLLQKEETGTCSTNWFTSSVFSAATPDIYITTSATVNSVAMTDLVTANMDIMTVDSVNPNWQSFFVTADINIMTADSVNPNWQSSIDRSYTWTNHGGKENIL